ncbi:hypothetical protein Egran_02876 [Elaphomyces granulatus]|uniref:Zn(2)-C6 fungal-type domain-containing protein n=1 Tax=Elaphomyces granulatus TaxID=519963 RepID=A0A232LYV6_9EURO|nr:hypothetical protein Egran_02876 [Elaphomyces granulatus]
MAARRNVIPKYPPVPPPSPVSTTTTASSPVSSSDSLNLPVARQRLPPVVHQDGQSRNSQAREQTTTIGPSVPAVSPVSPVSPTYRHSVAQRANIQGGFPVPSHVPRVDIRTYPCYTPSHRVHPSQRPYTHIGPDSGLNCAPRPLPFGQPVLSLDPIPSFQSAPDVIKNNQQNATSRKNTNSLLSPPKSTRRQPHPVIHHETGSPATDLTRKRPGSPPSPVFVIYKPGSPTAYREKRIRTKEEEELQKEDSRRLKEHGGACVWCYVNKKKCSTESPCRLCSSNKRMCFRDGSELWLCPPIVDQPKRNFQRAKENVFWQANQIFCRLQALWSPQPGITVAFAVIRQNDLPLLATDISQLSINDTRQTQGLKENMISASQTNIALTGLEQLIRLPLVDSAAGVWKLLAAITAVSRSFVYFRPSELQAARAAMFFILSIHAQALCEKSAEFCSQLYDTLRRKESNEQHHGETLPTDPVNPIWIALGLYYRVLSHLTKFEPAPSISPIFHGIKAHAETIIPNVRQLLMKNIPCKAKWFISTKPSLDDCLRESVPEIPEPNCFEIAFWMSDNKFPVSTALARQGKPFDHSLRYLISSILDEDFTFDIDPQNLANQGDGSQSSQLHSGARLDSNLQVTTAGDSWCQNLEQDLPAENQSSSSSDQQTNYDSIFDAFTNIDTLSSDVYDHELSPADGHIPWWLDDCFLSKCID